MAVQYQYLPHKFDGTPIRDLVGNANNPVLPGGIIDKLVAEFEETNPGDHDTTDTVFIPILPPFAKKHEGLVDKDGIFEFRRPKPEPVVEPIKEERYVPPTEPEPEPEPEPPPPPPKIRVRPERPKAPPQPLEKTGKLQYKSFPYTFSRPGETIEAVIRLYNDMSVSRAMINKLVFEFSKNNPDSNPPKLGQTVLVPVLLPFVYRHLNDNKIFTDE